MVAITLAAVFGLLTAASAMPKPGPRAVTQSSFDIEAIMAKPQQDIPSYQTGGLKRANTTKLASPNLATRACAHGTNAVGGCCASTAQLDWGENDTGGWGITVQNGNAGAYAGFYFYENNCDSIPYKYTWVAPGATVFITLPTDFQGRMTRGTDAMNMAGVPQTLGTWFEFNWEISTDFTGAWADISLIRGCDVGMMTWCMDGTGNWKGFTYDIMANAPAVSFVAKPDGTKCLSPTEDGGIDDTTDAYELTAVGPTYAYIDDAHGSPVVFSTNGRLGIYAPAGLI